MPGPSEAEEGAGPSPSRVGAGRAWDLQEGAGGLAANQLPFPQCFQPRCTTQTPLFRGGGRTNHRPSMGEISPQGQRQAPSTQPPVLADVRGHPCPNPGKAQEPRGCTGHKSPVAWGAVGLGPTQWPPRPCPCGTATFPGPSGHGRGSLCWGAGAVLPRRTLGGKDKRIFSAENSPSVSFPCPAPPGASGAAARPPADGISYPLNPCGAGAERQESQFIPRESRRA